MIPRLSVLKSEYVIVLVDYQNANLTTPCSKSIEPMPRSEGIVHVAQTMPLTVAAQNATRGPQWWYMSVLIMIMIAPVIALAIALERRISRGLLVGAVKA